jgi:hypothetical protein
VASRVSEVNLEDLRDVRAQLTGDDSQIEVRLGREDLTKRLRQSLEALDEERSTPRGAYITYIDMTHGKRAVIGSKPHAPGQSREALDGSSNDRADGDDAVVVAPEAKKPTVQTANKTRASVEKAKSKEVKKKQEGARESERTTTTGQTRGDIERPRRVGRSG